MNYSEYGTSLGTQSMTFDGKLTSHSKYSVLLQSASTLHFYRHGHHSQVCKMYLVLHSRRQIQQCIHHKGSQSRMILLWEFYCSFVECRDTAHQLQDNFLRECCANCFIYSSSFMEAWRRSGTRNRLWMVARDFMVVSRSGVMTSTSKNMTKRSGLGKGRWWIITASPHYKVHGMSMENCY